MLLLANSCLLVDISFLMILGFFFHFDRFEICYFSFICRSILRICAKDQPQHGEGFWEKGYLGAWKQRTGSQVLWSSCQSMLCRRQLPILLSLYSVFFLICLLCRSPDSSLSMFCWRLFTKQLSPAILKNSLNSSSPAYHNQNLLLYLSTQPFTPGFLLMVLK